MAPRSFGPAGPDATSRREQLKVEGHILDVIVHREPGAVEEEGLAQLFEAGGLIDTGASDICIDYRLAHELRLRQIDQQTVATPGGSLLAAVFLGVLEVPALDYKKLMPLFALKVGRASYNVILGRSFLADFIVTFDGPNGCFHFARRPTHCRVTPWTIDASVGLLIKIRIVRIFRIIRAAEPFMAEHRVTSTEFQKAFGRLREAALRAPVTITQHGRESLVLIAADEYRRLKSRERRALHIAELSAAEMTAILEAEIPADTSRFDDEVGPA